VRHYHRTHVTPTLVLSAADDFFPALGLARQSSSARSRVYVGDLGTVKLSAKPEGGHYTFIEAETDQVGESRLDRNVKRFFVRVHRQADPTHKLAAAY
jgi:predicted alpha/beta-fold hydrolase